MPRGLTIKQAADGCRVGAARIASMCRRGLLRARKTANGGRSTWYITMTVDEIVACIERQYPRERPLVFPTISYRLTDEECWACQGSFMAEGRGEARGYIVVDSEYRCPYCGQSDRLEWNGANYYCECRPWTPVFPDAVSKRYESNQFPYPATTTAVQPFVDESYAMDTKYYRVPAASNWPRGRNDPKVNRINEGAPRHTAGYSSIRSRR